MNILFLFLSVVCLQSSIESVESKPLLKALSEKSEKSKIFINDSSALQKRKVMFNFITNSLIVLNFILTVFFFYLIYEVSNVSFESISNFTFKFGIVNISIGSLFSGVGKHSFNKAKSAVYILLSFFAMLSYFWIGFLVYIKKFLYSDFEKEILLKEEEKADKV